MRGMGEQSNSTLQKLVNGTDSTSSLQKPAPATTSIPWHSDFPTPKFHRFHPTLSWWHSFKMFSVCYYYKCVYCMDIALPMGLQVRRYNYNMKGQDRQNRSGSTLTEGTGQEVSCIHQFFLWRHTGELEQKWRKALNVESESIQHFVLLGPVTHICPPPNPYPWNGQLSNQKNFILTYVGYTSFYELQLKKSSAGH